MSLWNLFNLMRKGWIDLLKNILSNIFKQTPIFLITKGQEVENFSHKDIMNTHGRGRRQAYRAKGQGRSFPTSNKGGDNYSNDEGKRYGKSQVQWFYCKNFGHYEYNC